MNMEMIVPLFHLQHAKAKGTAFSSLVAEVLNQIAKKKKTCQPVNLRPHLWRLVPNASDQARVE